MPASLFPILLITHIALAISLFLPSLLLPFAFRARRSRAGTGAAPPSRAEAGPTAPGVAGAPAGDASRFVRFMLALQSRGTLAIGIGLAVTGIGLVASLGLQLLEQPWLLVALVIYAANLGLAYFVQVPRLRQLVGLRSDRDPKWADLARRQRYVSYVMAGLVGTIGFLMSTKPALW